VDSITWQDTVVLMNSSHRMSRSRIVMFGGQDFMQDTVVMMYNSHRMSRSRIIISGGQDFMAVYCGLDIQLSQDV
jgi:hypothetical protein